jgi:hypothetical protein
VSGGRPPRPLDLFGIEAVRVRPDPEAEPIDWAETVRMAGLRNVVSSPSPQARVHSGEFDFHVPSSGLRIMCIAAKNWPEDPEERACEIIRRLAYGFHDWASREVVARHNRDAKREFLG